MKDGLCVRGMVKAIVYDKDGNIKRKKQNWIQKLFRIPGKQMIYKHHNNLTTVGEAMIADCLANASVLQKLEYGHGYIQVGTGWTGNSPKLNTKCNTPGGIAAIEEDYPEVQAHFGSEGQNILINKASFPAGSLVLQNINECALLNGNGDDALCFAYATLEEPCSISSADSLTIYWYITFIGV